MEWWYTIHSFLKAIKLFSVYSCDCAQHEWRMHCDPKMKQMHSIRNRVQSSDIRERATKKKILLTITYKSQIYGRTITFAINLKRNGFTTIPMCCLNILAIAYRLAHVRFNWQYSNLYSGTFSQFLWPNQLIGRSIANMPNVCERIARLSYGA